MLMVSTEYFDQKLAYLELLQVRVAALEAERADAIQRAEDASRRATALEQQLAEQMNTSKRNDRKLDQLSAFSRNLKREHDDLTEVWPHFGFSPSQIFQWALIL